LQRRGVIPIPGTGQCTWSGKLFTALFLIKLLIKTEDTKNQEVRALLAKITDEYVKRTPKSKKLFQRAVKVIPGGVGSSMHVTSLWPLPYPFYCARADGAHVFDIDGNDYTDYRMGYGAVGLFGHARPKSVLEAVKNELEKGVLWSISGETVVEVANIIKNMVPSAKMVMFAPTGTEANTNALKLARAYTKKQKFIKFEGTFHGATSDFGYSTRPPLEKAGPYSQPRVIADTEGLPTNAAENVVMLPFNDVSILEKAVKRHRKELCAVFVEPVILTGGGLIPPKEGYLGEVKRITEENDVLLVFDEVVTGFRISRGGAQEYYGVIPDLTVLGKVLASGFPIGAVGGREDILELASSERGTPKVRIIGTFTANPVSMAAAKATLTEINSNPSTHSTLGSKTEKVKRGLEDMISRHNVNAIVQAVPGAFQIFFTNKPVQNYRDTASSDFNAYDKFYTAMIRRGILLWGRVTTRQFVSIAHTDEDITRTIKTAGEVFESMVS
jgi:glutamate-1-semialdehyde 2,1-aminomutase